MNESGLVQQRTAQLDASRQSVISLPCPHDEIIAIQLRHAEVD